MIYLSLGDFNSESEELTTSGVSTQNSGQAQSNQVTYHIGVQSELSKKTLALSEQNERYGTGVFNAT